jgi:hypothetical protein
MVMGIRLVIKTHKIFMVIFVFRPMNLAGRYVLYNKKHQYDKLLKCQSGKNQKHGNENLVV